MDTRKPTLAIAALFVWSWFGVAAHVGLHNWSSSQGSNPAPKGAALSSAALAFAKQPTIATGAPAEASMAAQEESATERNQKGKTEDIPLASILPPAVALIGALLSIIFFVKTYRLNRILADRTLTVEAQKLLVEINKQFIADPDLFAVYDDHPGRAGLLASKSDLAGKIKALAYLKLNIFEIIFAVLPSGTSHVTWLAYFEDSLKRCSVLKEELEKQPEIYDSRLIEAYERWKNRSLKGNDMAIQEGDYYKQLGDDHRFFGDLRFKQMTVWSVATGVLINAALSRSALSPRPRSLFILLTAGIVITAIFWILEVRSTLKGVSALERMRQFESGLGARKERLGKYSWKYVNQTNAVVLLYALSYLTWWTYLICLLDLFHPKQVPLFKSSAAILILFVWAFLVFFTIREYLPLWGDARQKNKW